MGQGDVHGGVHPQPHAHEEPKSHDAFRGMPWEEARCLVLRTFKCVSHVKATRLHLSKHADGDPLRGKVVISRDVVFNEKAALDGGSSGAGKVGGVHDTFVVEHLVTKGGGDVGQVQQATGVASPEATQPRWACKLAHDGRGRG